MSSVTWAPIMCTPRTSSVSASAMTLTKPLVSPLMMALPLAWKGNLPTRVLRPAASHCGRGQTDGGDLRPRVRGPRHLHVVDRLHLAAGDGVDRGDALVGGHVRQPQSADDVADGVEVRIGRAHVAVDLDEAALHDGARRLQAHVLRVGGATGGHQQLLGTQLGGLLALLADHEADARLVSHDRRRVEAGAGDDLDAAALEGTLHLRRRPRRPRAAPWPAGTPARSPRCRGRGSSWRTRRPRRRRRRR